MTHGQEKKCRKYAGFVTVVLICITLTQRAVYAAPGYEDVADYSEMAAVEEVVKYGMTPITGDQVADGTYTVDTECSSSFFRILEAELTVEDGEMTAVLTMSSQSYSYVYPGTPEEAADADFEDYIPLETDGSRYTFTIPVEALNAAVSCAAFSKNREKWYGRSICFDASSLPDGALDFDLPDYDLIEDAVDLYDEENGTDVVGDYFASDEDDEAEASAASSGEAEAASVEVEDGTYSINVDMTGGSGRASVTTPTWLYVEDGKAYAKLLWSSTYYDYMIVGGVTYYNETTDGGNSTFTIPITAFDEGMTVIGDTTAMGDPIEIEYTLTFYADSIGSVSKVPQEAAKRVIVIAIIVIIAGGILNYLIKRRRRQ